LNLHDLANAEARGKRLEYIRKHLLNLSRPQFCENSGILLQSLKGWELGWGGGLTEKGAEKFIKHARNLGVHCTLGWLLHGVGPMAAQLNVYAPQNLIEDEQIAKELLVFKGQPGSVDSMVCDDLMQPMLTSGDYVAGIIVNDLNNAIDRPCIVLLEDASIWIRVLKSGDEPGCYDLASLRKPKAHLQKNVKLVHAAPISWIRKRHPENQEA